MRAPSLYVYFDSKNALYDAMFAEGYRVIRVRPRLPTSTQGGSPPAGPPARGALFVDFCQSRTRPASSSLPADDPGFEPSEPAYALARESLDRMVAVLASAGAGTPEHLDLWTALVGGLATQQVSNDPGGDRWRRLIDRAVDMFVATELATPPRRVVPRKLVLCPP